MTGELYYTVFSTPAGWVGLLASRRGLRRFVLPLPTEQEVRRMLAGGASEDPARFTDLTARLIDYFSGLPVDFPDELDLTLATPFQQAVWRAAQTIPRGETRTYGWLAGRIGKPGAARAVGQALGRNPIPVIIPCHRVLAAGGLGGFSGGLDMKRYLLRLEGNSAGG
jgi:methylated-DNA-[protein]-cysteine S-methyltransferase